MHYHINITDKLNEYRKVVQNCIRAVEYLRIIQRYHREDTKGKYDIGFIFTNAASKRRRHFRLRIDLKQ